MRYLLPVVLILSGCSVTRVSCTRGDTVTPYGSYGNVTKTPDVRSCTVTVKKNGLLNNADAQAIKSMLEAGSQ